jgi:transposase
MTNIRVIGLDVCCDRVVACLLTELPNHPQSFYLEHDFCEFPLNWDGFRQLMALSPAIAVYEPTGVAYSAVWVARLQEHGVKCYGVDHAKLRAYRKSLGLPDKDDFADSLALACYYLDPLKQTKFDFLRERDPVVQQVRSLILRLHHLDRRKSPIVNRLRQDLAQAFPERMNISCDNAPLFWGWLAGERTSKRYDDLLTESIGFGINDEIRLQAKALTTCLQEEQAIAAKLRHLVQSDDRFRPYLKVFAEFGFGERISTLILSTIFPLEDFLKDGKPEVRIRKGKKSGNPTTRHLSLRRFQKAIGVAPVREESGDKKRKRTGGSSLCRKALWQWVFTRIETKSATTNPRILEIRAIHQKALLRFKSSATDEKPRGVCVKLARAYTRRKTSILLFKALVDEVTKSV